MGQIDIFTFEIKRIINITKQTSKIIHIEKNMLKIMHKEWEKLGDIGLPIHNQTISLFVHGTTENEKSACNT